MAAKFSDQDIELLLAERKPLPADYRSRMKLRDKRGHKKVEFEIKGCRGSEFRLILRQSNFNPLDFSVILSYTPPQSNQSIRLRRYNGKSHEHTNQLKKPPSTTSISTRQLSVIRNLDPVKIPMLSRQRDMLIFPVRFGVLLPTVVLICLKTRSRICSRRFGHEP